MNAVTTTRKSVLQITSMADLMEYSKIIARSTMIPRDFQGKPENVIIAIQWGHEIGLAPLQALQNIAVINGRPSVWGDAALALVRGSGLCKDVAESVTGEGDNMAATCVAHRVGSSPVTSTFSVADAKKAGLWGKQGPWTQYARRMLQLRARGFALRDAFPDVLRGVITAEEAQDMPDNRGAPFAGPTIDAVAEVVQPDQPEPRKKRTWAEALDELEGDFRAAETREAVDAIIASDRVQKMLDTAQNGTRERLNKIVKAAIDRTAASGWFPDEPHDPATGERLAEV